MKIHLSKWLYLLILAPLAYFLFMPVYYSKTEQQSTLGNYLMGGFILVTVVVFMVDQIIQHYKERKNEQRKHSLELNEIYKRLCYVGFQTQSINRPEVTLTFPRDYYISPKRQISGSDKFHAVSDIVLESTKFNTITYEQLPRHPDYENFDFAIEHLKHKKYENIYKHWENVMNFIQSYNQGSHNVLNELDSELKLFSKELQNLVSGLRSRELIKGKCDGCP